VSFRVIRRGGRYLRVADPDWEDPLDASYAKATGQRWNPPGSFEVLYLNADRSTARLNVERLLQDQPYGPEDLDPGDAFLLIATDVRDDHYADAVTDDGCVAAGLPVSYPFDPDGKWIGHEICQPIGRDIYEAGLPGIACRSAAGSASGVHEELAYFPRTAPVSEAERWRFDEWFWSD
jgi:hypothetical protein